MIRHPTRRLATLAAISVLCVSALSACSDDPSPQQKTMPQPTTSLESAAAAQASAKKVADAVAARAAQKSAKFIVTETYRGEQSALRGITGVVDVDDKGCVSLTMPDGTTALAIWPKGYRLSDDGKKIEAPDGQLALGESLKESKGWLFTADQVALTDTQKQYSKYAQCSVENGKVVSFDLVEAFKPDPAVPSP